MIILIVLIPLLLAMAVVVLRIRRKHKMPQGIETYNKYGEKILSTENRLTRSLMCVPCTSWTGSAKVIGKQKDTTIYVIPFVSVSYKGNFPTTKFIKTWVNQDTVHWEYTRINNHFFDNDTLAIVLFIGEY